MKIYLVGGAVRDKLLGLPVKEKDWVVVGATVHEMLAKGFRQVGKEFPVFIHPRTGEEYALARMERKTKPGYKGFVFDTSPNVSLEEDLHRRDITINAMAYDPETNTIIDPYGGQKDLENKILRHVSAAFNEDPVRILRMGRFLARLSYLNFHIDPITLSLMRTMTHRGEVNALVAERVWKEVERSLNEKNPEKFFTTLAACDALPILFPEIKTEGIGMQALIKACQITSQPLIRFAALLHDIDTAGIKNLCKRCRVPNDYRELSILISRHYQTALDAQNKTAEELLKLLNSLDIYRRAVRFENFLLVCKSISMAHQLTFDAQWLAQCANIVKQVDVQALIVAGYEKNSLAQKLQEERLKNIERWLQHQN